MFQGELLTEIDIKTCFPTILSATFCNSLEERNLMQAWIGDSDFYRELYALSEDKDKPFTEKRRKSFKRAFNSWINGEMRCRNIERVMASTFPILYKDICDIREKNFKDLGCRLMKIEADIILTETLKRIWENNRDIFALSVHDSIYCLERHAGLFKAKLTQSFERVLGICPKLHVNLPNTTPPIIETSAAEIDEMALSTAA